MKHTQTLSNWNGPELSKEEVLKSLKATPGLYARYSQMNQDWRERFMDFCCGKRTLPLTYDPFFKQIFHPDVHPDRLSQLISSLLKVRVKVKGILPNEDSMMDGESLLILDILVELEDGSLSNIEIQKCPYAFPAERMSCYSSDLVMRQYTRIKGEKGRYFTYQDMKKVYTIVIFEKSTAAFRMNPPCYIHYGRTTFNTGLKIELLQEYCLIALDEFRKYPYPKDRSEQPEEVLGMYSEALRILDRNTVRYMIEEQQKEIDHQKTTIEDQQKEIEELKRQLEQLKTVNSKQTLKEAGKNKKE